MADNVGSKVSYFLVGLGVGALMGVLFAPKSGEDTREYLAKRADDGREFAQKKASADELSRMLPRKTAEKIVQHLTLHQDTP